MNQNSYQALTAMINSFPQSAVNLKALLLTYDQALSGVPDQAIHDAAANFIAGRVSGQSLTFAPSVAEFCSEARRTPVAAYRALPPPRRVDSWEPQPKEHRVRMGFKMSVLSAGLARQEVDRVAEANKRGLEDMIALGQEWGVVVPEEIWAQVVRAA